jgi:anti-anti-sigma factor
METIGWEDHEGARWIQLEGEIDHNGVEAIRTGFQDAVQKSEGDVVVVMSGVTFMASVGLRLLLEARETLLERGQAVRLTGLRPNVRRLLEETNLLKLFE